MRSKNARLRAVSPIQKIDFVVEIIPMPLVSVSPGSIFFSLRFDHNFWEMRGRRCAYVSMCFLPKRRASMDHARGPIMAAVPPRVASTIIIEGSPGRVKAIHSSTTAIKVPATGVQRPMSRKMPTQAATISGNMDVETAAPVREIIPKRTRMTAARTRCNRRPTPGQPFAKVEKSRCK
jgi:hypothetical protein